jgi:hypothetical protein
MFCCDWQSVHQPHLILTKGDVFISGPPQERYEQCDDRQFDREDSEFFQSGFLTLMPQVTYLLIWRGSCRTPVFFPDFWRCGA